MKVLDLMTGDVLTAAPDETLKTAARKMVAAGVSGLPVVDEGRVVGIITEADFVEQTAERSEGGDRRLLGVVFGEAGEPVEAETVQDVMTAKPIVIYSGASLGEAARVMAHNGVKRLPVVDEDGRLLGIISRADIVTAFVRPDDVIEDEIREDVIRRTLQLPAEDLVVEVHEGVVTLRGAVPTRSDVRLLEALVARLDGVVHLTTDLVWSVDDTRSDDV
jgi:CBS domain-containing protein